MYPPFIFEARGIADGQRQNPPRFCDEQIGTGYVDQTGT